MPARWTHNTHTHTHSHSHTNTNTHVHTHSYLYSLSHLGCYFRMLFQSPKLKARTSLLPRFNKKRHSSCELWKSFSKMSPRWDWLYLDLCTFIYVHMHIYRRLFSYIFKFLSIYRYLLTCVMNCTCHVCVGWWYMDAVFPRVFTPVQR